MKFILMDYLKNRLGNIWNVDNNDFEKCMSNKINGFCCILNKKWKELNYCITKLKKKKIFLATITF
jgi:hypothetical protein